MTYDTVTWVIVPPRPTGYWGWKISIKDSGMEKGKWEIGNKNYRNKQVNKQSIAWKNKVGFASKDIV